ncbi:hypothetical protein B296_00018205 [Ensete ventricosum]|uniref:Uncharacterized protein n=1 Tax=Ensete ventricosum TaxID=4639 RepID=A0A427AE73_ENSVE|nr:hypothetical protein B296_00018205 [Ensete ventricosum]
MSTEAFLGLTQQVQTLARMIQAIVPYIPQSAQALAYQRSDAPNNEAPHHLPNEVMTENPNASVSQPTSRSRNVVRTPPEPDIVSSYSTNSVREQLCQVNQRLDEVQRDFVKSKEEVRETTKGGSPFVPEIQDKPIPPSF